MKYIFPLILLVTITVGVIIYTFRVLKEKLFTIFSPPKKLANH